MEAPPIVVEEFEAVELRRDLIAGRTYSMAFDGFTLLVSPPMDDWLLLGFQQSRAVLGWEGPNGFRPGTLDLAVFDVSLGGVDEAWDRIEALRGDVFRDLDWEWTWVDQGTTTVGNQQVEWREVRFPPIPPDDEAPADRNFVPVIDSPFEVWLGHDSSARFYVVPVGDLTATVLAWESRCRCAESVFRRESFVDRDVENELSMWIDELEAFVGGLKFVES